jgi:hypothetical protein
MIWLMIHTIDIGILSAFRFVHDLWIQVLVTFGLLTGDLFLGAADYEGHAAEGHHVAGCPSRTWPCRQSMADPLHTEYSPEVVRGAFKTAKDRHAGPAVRSFRQFGRSLSSEARRYQSLAGFVRLPLLGQFMLLQCEGVSACGTFVFGSPYFNRTKTTADPHAAQTRTNLMVRRRNLSGPGSRFGG